MTYWFKPGTHWHEITEDAAYVLGFAGYDYDMLEVRYEQVE